MYDVPYRLAHLLCFCGKDPVESDIKESGKPIYTCANCFKFKRYDVRHCKDCGDAFLASEFVSPYKCYAHVRCYACIQKVTEFCDHEVDISNREYLLDEYGIDRTIRDMVPAYRKQATVDDFFDFLDSF